jgi:hypothetical protein
MAMVLAISVMRSIEPDWKQDGTPAYVDVDTALQGTVGPGTTTFDIGPGVRRTPQIFFEPGTDTPRILTLNFAGTNCQNGGAQVTALSFDVEAIR